MKLKLILFVLIMLFYFGCGSKKDNTNPSESNQDKIEYKQGDQYILKMGYKLGEKYNYTLVSTQENTQTMNDQTQANKVKTTYKMTTEIISKDSSGEFDMKIKFNKIKIEADLGPQGFLSFDSDNPADTVKNNSPAFLQYSVLIGNHYFARFNSKGEVTEIYKIDNILKKLLGPNPEKIPDNAKSQIRLGIESMLTKTTQQLFQFLPENPIKIDSSWYKIYDEKLDVLEIQNKAIYTLKSVTKSNNNDIAHLEGTLISESIGKRNFENKGTKINYDKPVVNATGITDFDLGRGVVLKRDLKTYISISMTAIQGGKTMKVNSKFVNKVNVDLE